jgi:hypothetical protein
VDRFVAADKSADGFVMGADRFQRLRDRGISRNITGIDPALEFGERHHWHYFIPCEDRTGFTERERMGQAALPVIPGRATWREPGIHNHGQEYGFRACAKWRILRCAIAHRRMTTPFPTPSG